MASPNGQAHAPAGKHEAPTGNSPVLKRVHLTAVEAEAEAEAQEGGDAADRIVGEADVGITAYVNESLAPISGGIIKQRFSDFHVREVSSDGTVCHLRSLYPAAKSQGGTGLYEHIAQLEAEMNDSTGELARERREKEASERAAREEERQKEAERVFEWQVGNEEEAKLSTLLGDEALSQLKKMWEEGPSGWKKTGTVEGGEGSDEGQEPSPSEQTGSTMSRGGRGGRGGRGRGRGGRGGGREGGDGGGGQDPRSVVSKALASKEERTAVHQLVRQLFEGLLTTDTVETASADDESVKVSAIRMRWMSTDPSRMRFDRRNGPQQEDQPPPYIHFLLQKTNRESQDALNIVARSLGLIKPGMGGSKAMRELSVAGTKDKRAVTVQKVAFRRGRRDIDEVWKMLNGVGRAPDGGGRGGRGGQRGGGSRVKTIKDALCSRGDRGIRVGHLEYAQEALHLGQLQGNEFVIVLRDVQIESPTVVEQAIDVLQQTGFINYYGMQRFGTSVVSTHTVGIALFRNDFHQAVSLIMAPRPGDTEEVQEAREAYAAGDLEKCFKLMPHHHIPERSILQRIMADKQSQSDWKSYFMAIPRALRTMYVHAYQSYIWNRMVTERVRRFGLKSAVIGDIVLLDGGGEGEQGVQAGGEDDDDDDDAHANGQDKGEEQKRVKVLESEDDVRLYSIHDIVMPLPGNQIQLAEGGWMAEVYKSMLAEDGLTAEDVGNSTTPEFALKGDYRKVLHLPRNVSYKLLRYRHANANLCQSDEDEILGLEAPEAKEWGQEEDGELQEGESVAMLLRLTLGVSAYATMALREVLKQDTSVAHQKELTERAERQRHRPRSPAYRNEAVNRIQGRQTRTWGAPKAEEAQQEAVGGERQQEA